MSEVYLLWESYKTNELLPIGILRQIGQKEYEKKTKYYTYITNG